LRVLHLGKFHPPHPGGVERHMADLMQAQVSSGLDTAALVHASPRDRTRLGRRDVGGALVDTVACHGQLIFAPVSPAWPLHLHRLLRDFRPDVLHLHVPNTSVFWLLFSPPARRLPWVVHWHADVPDDSSHAALRLAYPPYRAFERAVLKRAARIVATSETYRAASKPLAPFAHKASVIPLGSPASMPPGTAPAWPAAGMKVLAVGRLSYYKGFDLLLQAMARVPEASLLLVGSGELEGELREEIGRLGIAGRVRMAGNVDDATLQAAYEACDVFCLPSIDRAEAFGMVLLEAMRAGKPVIASDIPGSGVGSVVAHGETALLVPPRDVAALATALQAMAGAPGMRRDFGAAGRARWEREYRIDAVNRRWASLYADVVRAPTAR
jgi:glycosyltransferase involved in cell wall biosynthesis